MKRSGLRQVSIRISAVAEDPVAELFALVFGQPAVIYADARTQVRTASVYCSLATTELEWRKRLLRAGWDRLRRAGLAAGPCRIRVRLVKREDWAESWKRHFRPLEIGRLLLIRPSWSRRRPKPGQAVVVLDPGLSFGTGQHPTTRFCLEQIVAARVRGCAQSFLDVGTGSGILALAAARLGFSPVEALDSDPVSVRVARANARLNGVGARIRLRHGDAARLARQGRRRFDVVCANLTDDLLVAHAARLARQLRPGGRLVVAGILGRQFASVQRALAASGLRRTAARAEGEWKSGTFESR
jgi:ribosomal protein L11 methyltransferase